MILLGISTTGGAANFVVTLLRMRAHGMSIDRLPIIVWGTLTASVANLVAVPSVSLAFLLLWLDRNAGTHFGVGAGREAVAGGDPPLNRGLAAFGRAAACATHRRLRTCGESPPSRRPGSGPARASCRRRRR